jgi:hypothetical protein
VEGIGEVGGIGVEVGVFLAKFGEGVEGGGAFADEGGDAAGEVGEERFFGGAVAGEGGAAGLAGGVGGEGGVEGVDFGVDGVGLDGGEAVEEPLGLGELIDKVFFGLVGRVVAGVVGGEVGAEGFRAFSFEEGVLGGIEAVFHGVLA